MSTQLPDSPLVCYTPTGPLGDFVECLWLLSNSPAHSREQIAPSGAIDLKINLHENEHRIYDPAQPERSERFSGAVVSGTHSGPFVIDPRELVSVMGVHFRPGGAAALVLGLSAMVLGGLALARIRRSG
jgi:hypothetical protein